MAGLLVAQKVTGAAQFQVLHGHVETGAERRVLRDGGEPVMGLLGHRLGRVVQEVGVRALAAATDAATQLMELAQAETVGMVDDQRVRIGDIKTGLDDCGTHEHVDVAMPEVADDLVELLLPHLAVGDADVRLGHQRVDLVGDGRDVLHTIVDIEHLAASQQFAAYGCGDLRILVGAHIGQHRQPVFGRGGERGHLANAGHGHFQRARDGVADRAARPRWCAGLSSVSLCSTPKRCSSSMMTSPRSLNLIFGFSSLCVPMTTSTVPVSSPSMASLSLFGGLESAHGRTLTGKPSNRSLNVS